MIAPVLKYSELFVLLLLILQLLIIILIEFLIELSCLLIDSAWMSLSTMLVNVLLVGYHHRCLFLHYGILDWREYGRI
jgi:hypothetical protein